jgi:hypothetical protein
LSAKPPALGDIIEVYCPRCRLNLDANVAAVHLGEIKKVECRTCGNFVDYKPPVDMEAKKSEALKKLLRLQEKKHKAEAKAGTAPQPTTAERARWDALTKDIDSRSARVYDRLRAYKPGAFILHKQHGMGHVESADDDEGTMIVLFQGGLVSLEHNQTPDE